MRDDQLERTLDAWGDSERLSTPPMPEAFRQGVRGLRLRRAASLGAAVIAALVMIVALVSALATDEPAPESPSTPIVEPLDETSIGAIYSRNNRFRDADREIELPATHPFGEVEPVMITDR